MFSRGSVAPFFINSKNKGFLPITDKEMTRFNITLNQGVNFVILSLNKMWGGEVFIPKIPSYNILDLAKAINPKNNIKEIGIRSGEKLHEEMITVSDSYNTIEAKNFYIILPNDINNLKKYIKIFKAKKIKKAFSYNSLENPDKFSFSAVFSTSKKEKFFMISILPII